MNTENKTWLNTDDGKKKQGQTESDIGKTKQPTPLKSDEIKEEEKRHGLVDEDHPFPSKGN